MQLVPPAPQHLPAYIDALQRGWAPTRTRPDDFIALELARIAADATAFLASLEDVEAQGEPVELPDGSVAPRVPWLQRWLWDGDFCGVISLRWSRDGPLPPHVLGHVGYAVVPWKRGRRLATSALRQMLPEAWSRGLAHVDVVTEPDNMPSQRTALGAGATLAERLRKPEAFGGGEALRYRIAKSP